MRTPILLSLSAVSIAIAFSATAADDIGVCSTGPPAAAIQACTRIIAADGADVTALAGAYFNRGVSYVQQGDADRAIADWGKAIELKPDFAEPYFNRALALSRKSNADGAIADFSMDIKLRPDHGVAYYGRGVAYAGGKNDPTKALLDFEAATRLLPMSDPLRQKALDSIQDIRVSRVINEVASQSAAGSGICKSLDDKTALKSPLCVRYFFECREPPAGYLAYLESLTFSQKRVVFYEGAFEYSAQNCETFSYPEAEAALRMKKEKYGE